MTISSRSENHENESILDLRWKIKATGSPWSRIVIQSFWLFQSLEFRLKMNGPQDPIIPQIGIFHRAPIKPSKRAPIEPIRKPNHVWCTYYSLTFFELTPAATASIVGDSCGRWLRHGREVVAMGGKGGCRRPTQRQNRFTNYTILLCTLTNSPFTTDQHEFVTGMIHNIQQITIWVFFSRYYMS